MTRLRAEKIRLNDLYVNLQKRQYQLRALFIAFILVLFVVTEKHVELKFVEIGSGLCLFDVDLLIGNGSILNIFCIVKVKMCYWRVLIELYLCVCVSFQIFVLVLIEKLIWVNMCIIGVDLKLAYWWNLLFD